MTQPTTPIALPANTLQREAAMLVLDSMKVRVLPAGDRVLRIAQWAMGNLQADGIMGPKTRARGAVLGVIFPANQPR